MSRAQKARQRKRLRAVDETVNTVGLGLASQGKGIKKLLSLKDTLPPEQSMAAKDKYWVFSRYARNYRKGAHRQPKFTKISNRVHPDGF